MNRRRFLQVIAAGSLSVPATMKAWANTAPPPLVKWRGTALGAVAKIAIQHENSAHLLQQARREIARLEDVFSLYTKDSALSQLNQAGRLENPPMDLIALLSLCDELHETTNGAFDPTVQPLWSLYASRYASGRAPSRTEIGSALERTGWRHIAFSTEAVTLSRQGAALTLNGIAQGYIADKTAAVLRGAGITDVLVDVGEIVAAGIGPDGAPWPVEIAAAGDRRPGRVPLADSAIATSSPLGTVFDPAGTVGHILDAQTGCPGGRWRQITVIAESAARADGLSTAFCLMDERAIQRTSANTKAILVR